MSSTTNHHSSNEMRDISFLSTALRSFVSAPHSAFQLLYTLPNPHAKTTPKSLYILDSSFNPPTRAHLRICTSALLHDGAADQPKRLLLLLATQNADKAPQPAAFEHRLAMMSVFAGELVKEVFRQKHKGDVEVDVGVTKEARFVDKARVLEECAEYSSGDEENPVAQVHLVGYDTLIRLLDTKYYPPLRTLEPLEGIFRSHRVRVTRRTDDAWGGREEQDAYLRRLEKGDRENEGGRREWAQRIDLVEGKEEGEDTVSSTKVREAVKRKDEPALMKMVTEGVGRWILDEKLYLE